MGVVRIWLKKIYHYGEEALVLAASAKAPRALDRTI
jgi:hypothetical protein